MRETSDFNPIKRDSARIKDQLIDHLTTILLKVMSLIQRTICVFVPMSDAEHTTNPNTVGKVNCLRQP